MTVAEVHAGPVEDDDPAPTPSVSRALAPPPLAIRHVTMKTHARTTMCAYKVCAQVKRSTARRQRLHGQLVQPRQLHERSLRRDACALRITIETPPRAAVLEKQSAVIVSGSVNSPAASSTTSP